MWSKYKHNKLIKNLIYMDFLGPMYGFEDNDSLRFKSFQGSLLSLIIVVLVTTASFMFGKEIYQKQLPTVSVNSEFLSESKIYFKYFPIIFHFSTINGTDIIDFTPFLELVSFSIQTDLSNKVTTTYDNLNLTSCSNKSFTTNKNNGNNKGNDNQTLMQKANNKLDSSNTYFCIDFEDDDFFKNENLSTNSVSYNFGFKLCKSNNSITSMTNSSLDNNTNYCTGVIKSSSEEAILDYRIEDILISVYYVNSYVDYYNSTKPIQSYWENINYKLSNTYLRRSYMKFLNNQFNSDNGWLFEKIETFDYIQLQTILPDSMLLSDSGIEDDLVYLLTLESPRFRAVIKRHYLKVQDIFAKIGGVMNVLLILSKILFSHYLRFLYLIFVRDLTKDTMEKRRFAYKPGLNSFYDSDNSVCNVDYKNINANSTNNSETKHHRNKHIFMNDNPIMVLSKQSNKAINKQISRESYIEDGVKSGKLNNQDNLDFKAKNNINYDYSLKAKNEKEKYIFKKIKKSSIITNISNIYNNEDNEDIVIKNNNNTKNDREKGITSIQKFEFKGPVNIFNNNNSNNNKINKYSIIGNNNELKSNNIIYNYSVNEDLNDTFFIKQELSPNKVDTQKNSSNTAIKVHKFIINNNNIIVNDDMDKEIINKKINTRKRLKNNADIHMNEKCNVNNSFLEKINKDLNIIHKNNRSCNNELTTETPIKEESMVKELCNLNCINNNNLKFEYNNVLSSESNIALELPPINNIIEENQHDQYKKNITIKKTLTKNSIKYLNNTHSDKIQNTNYIDYLSSIVCCRKELRYKYESQMTVIKHSISFKILTNFLIGFILEDTSMIGDQNIY